MTTHEEREVLIDLLRELVLGHALSPAEANSGNAAVLRLLDGTVEDQACFARALAKWMNHAIVLAAPIPAGEPPWETSH